MKITLPTETRDKIVTFFKEKIKIQAVYLHGSFAKGTSREDSDIDIALLVNRSVTIKSLELLEFSGTLAVITGYHYDLAVLSTRDVVLGREVIKNGECLYCGNQYEKDVFEMLTLSMYANLQYERREVLDAYRI